MDVSNLDMGAPDDALHAAIEVAVASAARDPWLQDGDFQAVGCVVRFEGATDSRAAVQKFVRTLGAKDLRFEGAGAPWAVVRVHDATTPRRDLRQLGLLRTPVGALARLLTALEPGGEQALPRDVEHALTSFVTAPWHVEPTEHPLPASPDLVRAAALDLLEQLLAQGGTA